MDILCVRQKTTLMMRHTAVEEKINRDAALHKKCKMNLKAAGMHSVIRFSLMRNSMLTYVQLLYSGNFSGMG